MGTSFTSGGVEVSTAWPVIPLGFDGGVTSGVVGSGVVGFAAVWQALSIQLNSDLQLSSEMHSTHESALQTNFSVSQLAHSNTEQSASLEHS